MKDPMLIRMVNETPDWLVSFSDHNPKSEDCIEFNKKEDALKLIRLVGENEP